jgi:hypothetical protein
LTTTEKIEPIHPGEVLMEDFIEGFGITQNKLAVSIGVPPRRINDIVHGKRGGSPRTPRCGWQSSSAHRRSSGLTCRATTSSTVPRISRESSPRRLPRCRLLSACRTLRSMSSRTTH